ncbi:MAG: hypothetical protein JWP97_587 [Labilithrix sp.]|nr:hypothetical protein [Labilithrix sp.]
MLLLLSLVAGGAASVAAVACGVSPAITVVHLGPGEAPDPVKGDAVKFRRGAQESYADLRGGFYVVRGDEDWRNAWSVSNPPPFPSALDTARNMLVLAVAEKPQTVRIKIERIVENASTVVFYVRETALGAGCVDKPDRAPFDAIVTPRIDKPVRFVVAADAAESCGDPPQVTVSCRVGDAAAWAPRVTAQPGDVVDCEMTAAARGKFAIVDSALMLNQLPHGSTSKLSYSRAPVRGSFTADVFGTYGVHGEATDDSGRKTDVAGVIDVLPPKTRDVVVQLTWTNFDASDDPSTFPRVKLKATEEGAKTPATCSLDAPRADACEVKARGAYTTMKLKAGSRKYALDVQYTDERIEKGPMVCIDLFFDGGRTGEACDRMHRDASGHWQAGVVDMTTGAFYDPTLANADAGADGGNEAGARK